MRHQKRRIPKSFQRHINQARKRASEKVQANGRKALTDISNSGRPHWQGTSKKNQTAKLSIPVDDLEDIAEEGFIFVWLFMCRFLQTFCISVTASASPPRYAEPNDMTAMLIGELSHLKHKLSRKLESWPASPEPLDHYMQWDDLKYIPSVDRINIFKSSWSILLGTLAL